MYPEYEAFVQLAHAGNVVPAYKEILADTETPVSAYLKIRGQSPNSFLLESVEGGEKIGRYSFLGAGPFQIFRSRRGKATLEDVATGQVKTLKDDPVTALRGLVGAYKSVHQAGLPRFTGGAVGYLAYDAIRLVERIPDACKDDLGADDIVLLFFDTILAFDNVTHKIALISNVHLDGDRDHLRDRYDEAQEKIQDLERLLLRPVDPLRSKGVGRVRLKSNISKEEFEESVRRAKEYILAGDVIQVVLSQRLEAEISVQPFDIYRMLRVVNPSPYMYHIALGDTAIVGSSPELLVRVEDGVLDTRPLAGTRPRGATEDEDVALEQELLADEKERAEHVMLLDLGRNDIGRVAQYKSVRVTEQMDVERYSHVMHIVSNVRGKLRKDKDQFDALFSCFPAGTVSGAPKIRAMEIIDELERTRRGVYAGSVGYLDFAGNLDSCIAIRTLFIKGKKAYLQVGAGIVADSDPEREYQETMNKAKALIHAIEMAENEGFRDKPRTRNH